MEITTITEDKKEKKGPGQPEKYERNVQIYEDWKYGMTYFDMRIKYHISENSIRKILLRMWDKFGYKRDGGIIRQRRVK